eukprot:707149-Amphidinium_carterae.1
MGRLHIEHNGVDLLRWHWHAPARPGGPFAIHLWPSALSVHTSHSGSPSQREDPDLLATTVWEVCKRAERLQLKRAETRWMHQSRRQHIPFHRQSTKSPTRRHTIVVGAKNAKLLLSA